MTGVFDQARASADLYRSEITTAADTVATCVRRIDEALAQISGSGPLGDSDDPNLITARGQLAQARAHFSDAARFAHNSLESLDQLIQRVFVA